MPEATSIDGTPIYYETDGSGDGPPLLLLHPWTSYRQAWRDFGYVERLKRDHALVLLDARGHGRSGAPHDPAAYAPERFVEDVLAVADELGAERFWFWGYSMGAAAGFAVANAATERVIKLVCGGMHPYRATAGRQQWVGETVRLLREQGMEGFVERRERELGGRLAGGMRDRLLSADAIALAAAAEGWLHWDGLEGGLDKLRMPSVLYAGEGDDAFHDLAMRAAEEMPEADFISLPRLGHDAAFASSRTVLAALGGHIGTG
ncbi:MAG: alpha/beta fold hydrolase [Chloroflexota bacterium]